MYPQYNYNMLIKEKITKIKMTNIKNSTDCINECSENTSIFYNCGLYVMNFRKLSHYLLIYFFCSVLLLLTPDASVVPKSCFPIILDDLKFFFIVIILGELCDIYKSSYDIS
jgi:hypothetical protein